MSQRAETHVLDRFTELLDQQVNTSLRRGSLAAGILGLIGGSLLYVFQAAGFLSSVDVPAAWAAFGGTFSMIVYLLARRGRMRGSLLFWIFLPYASVPSSIFLLAELLGMPSGAATYITGPASYLYFFFVLLSGFLFNPRLSIFTGILLGLEYGLVIFVSQDELAKLSHPDPIMLEDMSTPAIYFFKALMMGFAGFLMAFLAKNANKLIHGIIEQENEKRNLDRLFGQFVSTEVKDKIIREKQDVIGERKLLVVLFSDIRSFSSYSEGLSPEEIVTQLNEYFDRMVKAVTEQGGVIDKFIGDALMATFGGLLALDNPSQSAYLAAKAMRVELDDLNRIWAAQGRPQLDNGIGLHFGEVLEGTLGSRDRKEFTVIGDTVNTASRLEGLTKEYGRKIIVSDAVFEQLDSASKAELENLGTTNVKGKAQPVNIYG